MHVLRLNIHLASSIDQILYPLHQNDITWYQLQEETKQTNKQTNPCVFVLLSPRFLAFSLSPPH